MPLHAAARCLLLALVILVCHSVHAAAPAEWAVTVNFPAPAQETEQRIRTDRGDEVALRRFVEVSGERFILTRITYPVTPLAVHRGALFKHTIETLMNSRSGEIREDNQFELGTYAGHRLLIEQRRERSLREVRLLLVGGALYFASAEWPAAAGQSARVKEFWSSLAVAPAYADARVMDDRSRWRELAQGNFQLRYDSSRWFRDPATVEENLIVLLRVDELAEAEFMAGPQVQAATMEELVLATAKESAERVTMRRRGKKLQGSTTVEELRFSVRVDGVTYENHGYFYNGPEGSVQVRAWSPEKNFAEVEGDIAELLDGLSIAKARMGLVAR
ncbi:MAG: hypothetical protein KBC32_05680 [Candidatus Didemnitutus sp.]|nr:hypothetical protein [Candidatus Didemnitutus sp.]